MASNGITIKSFDGTNYSSWKIRINGLLAEQRLDETINKDPPTDEPELIKWRKLDKRAKGLITLAIFNRILTQIKSRATSKKLLETLAKTYESKGKAARANLRHKFYTYTKDPATSMVDHLNNIMSMSDQLATLGASVDEKEIISVILNSLPSEYELLVISLESPPDTLTIEEVKRCILGEEKR
jgi:hypothetical protein